MQRTLRVNDSQLASLADKARQDNSISGYMSKRSADSTKWQLRWFVLYQNLLFYYDNESAARPSGVIFLEGCYCERLITTAAGKNKEDKQFCFAITFKKEGQRQYELRTETESECAAWIDGIRQASFDTVVLLKEELEQKHLHLLQIVESEKTAKRQYGQQCEELTAEIKKLRAELNALKRERRYPALTQFVTEDSEDIRKIKKVQSFFRGWLCRRRWKQIVEEYIRSPHAEGMRKRNSIVFSMVECEEEYVQQLQTLITCFLGPFKMAASSKKPPITHEDVNSIFLNSETVLFLHQIFLKGLMARMENWPTLVLGDLFDMLLPVLSIYQEYVRNHHFSLQVLAECKQNAQFSPLLKLYEEKQACEGRSLESFLTYPMHQIPRYIITLHELLAHTPHNHVERKSLEYAKNKLEELSRIMHDEVSETENIRKNLAIERQIVEGCDILLDVNQVFIRQGSLIQVNHEKIKSQRGRFGSFKTEKESVHQCFLFSNHLLLTTRTSNGRLHLAKYGGKIPLVDSTLIEDPSEQFFLEDDECSISSQVSQLSLQSNTLSESSATTSKEKVDYQNRDFKLIVDTRSGPPVTVHLVASTNLEKAGWTSDISQCIDNLHFHDFLNSSMSDTSSVTMPQSVRSDPRLFKDDIDIRFSRTLNSCKLPQIRYATPERLLERLTDLRFLSIDFLNTFLLTYHVFTTGATVLDALKRVYRNPEPLIFDSSTVSGSIGSIDVFSSGSSGSRVEFSISPPENKSGFLMTDNRRVSTGSMPGTAFENLEKESSRIFTGQIQGNQHWRWSFRKYQAEKGIAILNEHSWAHVWTNNPNCFAVEEGQKESLKEIRESAPSSPTPEHAANLGTSSEAKTVTFQQDEEEVEEEEEEPPSNAFLSIPKTSAISSSSSDTLSDSPPTPSSTATSTATLAPTDFSPKSSPIKKVAPITLSPPLIPPPDFGMLKPEDDTPKPRPPSPITPSHSAPSMFTYLKSRTNKRGSTDTVELSSSPRSSFQYPDGSPKHHGKAGVVVTSSRASTRRSGSSCATAAFAAATAGSGNPRETPNDLPRGINRYHSAGAGDMKIPFVKKRDSSVISTAATMRVLNVLRHWVSKHPQDFECNIELKEMAVDFLEEMVCNTNLLPAEHKAAAQILRTLIKEDPTNVKIDMDLLLAPALTPAKENIESLSALEIAEQMTYMDHKIFINIRSEEFLGQAWMKPEKATKAPHILLITKHFNEMSKLVVSEIICRPNIQDRAMVIEKWAAVADICRCFHNFNGVLQICAAFVNSSVYRLKKTWEKLSKTTKQTIDKLQTLVSSDGRFRNMREALHRSDPPCIPYLGMYLTDLSFIEEGTPNFTEDGLVNFSKMRMIAHVIREIRVFQQTPYKIEHSPKVTNYLLDASLLLSDDELYTKSLNLEPRQSRLSIISLNPRE